MSAPEPWQRRGQGWTRRMYGAEVGFAAFATHASGEGFGSLSTHATYTSSAVCSPNEFAKLLRRAWTGVRFNLHPLLAAVSTAPCDVLDTEGYSLYYPDVEEADVEVWAEETIVQHDKCTITFLVATLKQVAPTARNHRASIHFAPSPIANSFHIVFVAGHWLTDGRGALKIFNYILNNLNTADPVKMNWGDEVARLSIPLPLATGRRVAKSGIVIPLPQDKVDAVISMLIGAKIAAHPEFSHSPYGDKVDVSIPDVVHEIRLSLSESNALLHVCRAQGVSVTAVLNVLLTMSFVGKPASLSGSKTVPMPFFPADRGRDLLEGYRDSVGLQVVLFPLGLDSDVIRSCWNCYSAVNVDAIWDAARESKKQIVEAVSHDIGLTYEHEILCAVLPGLIGGTGAPFYQAALPFATSIGRMTDFFVPDANHPTSPRWTIDHVANSFTARWFRPVAHYWEWRGGTTVRIVASAEYDKIHSVEKMKEDMMERIRQLI